jgi:hypothetical protein
MCYEWFERRERRREERFDDELRYLLDETERPEPPVPVVEREPEERPAEVDLEAVTGP